MKTDIKALQLFVERVTSNNVVFPIRSKSKMYPLDYCKCVVELYNIMGSLRAVASVVQASISTISRWIKNINPKHSQRASKPKTITEEMLLAIKLYLYENPTHSANQVKNFLNVKHNISVSRQLIQIAISKRINLSFKKSKKRGQDLSDSKEFKIRKREFVRELNKVANSGTPIVSIDESGVDQRPKAVYGYSPVGSPLILCSPKVNIPHVRTSVLMAISSTGIEQHELTNISITSEIFKDFILKLPFQKGTTLLMDNHSMHDTEHVKHAIKSKGYNVIFTPPYSPELNPIEMIFGTIKSEFYKKRFQQDFTSVKDTLEHLIQKHATPEKIPNYIRHVTSFVARLYADAERNEGVFEASIQVPTHSLSDRWKGIRNKHKLTNAKSPKHL